MAPKFMSLGHTPPLVSLLVDVFTWPSNKYLIAGIQNQTLISHSTPSLSDICFPLVNRTVILQGAGARNLGHLEVPFWSLNEQPIHQQILSPLSSEYIQNLTTLYFSCYCIGSSRHSFLPGLLQYLKLNIRLSLIKKKKKNTFQRLSILIFMKFRVLIKPVVIWLQPPHCPQFSAFLTLFLLTLMPLAFLPTFEPASIALAWPLPWAAGSVLLVLWSERTSFRCSHGLPLSLHSGPCTNFKENIPII